MNTNNQAPPRQPNISQTLQSFTSHYNERIDMVVTISFNFNNLPRVKRCISRYRWIYYEEVQSISDSNLPNEKISQMHSNSTLLEVSSSRWEEVADIWYFHISIHMSEMYFCQFYHVWCFKRSSRYFNVNRMRKFKWQIWALIFNLNHRCFLNIFTLK